MYAATSSLNFQASWQVVCELLDWEIKRNYGKVIGMCRRCKAFVRADKEQDRGTLHDHCLVWIGGFDKVRKFFFVFDQDPSKQEATREEIEDFVNRHFCSDYEDIPSFDIIHEDCQ